MTDILAGWHSDHLRFARLLGLLDAQIAAFHGGAQPNYDLIADIVFYLHSYADTVHHPREEVAFKRLAAREPALELELSRLAQEHKVIAAAGNELLERLNEAAADAVAPRGALEAAAATYVVYYRNHLASEERGILPRARQLFTPQDWAAIEATGPVGVDPLFGDRVEERYLALRRQIDREAALPPNALDR